MDHYTNQLELFEMLKKAKHLIEVDLDDHIQVDQKLREIHARHPFDAILCLLDLRLIDAARIAEQFQLSFIRHNVATLLRDKYSVRQKMSAHCLKQPD